MHRTQIYLQDTVYEQLKHKSRLIEPLAKLPTNKCGKLFSAPEKPFFEQG
jgi:hypothetical protein